MVTIPTTFKAYQFASYGDVLKEAKLNTEVRQKPLEPTQVRVKVVSAAVNPLDYKLLQYGAAFLPTAPTAEKPFSMGFDTAGVVVEVGSGAISQYLGCVYS
ncbi:2-methylene-furan-3-one reductase [Phytophthora citrophthora]|uniref:2-methylene-furan-3-one reductase n=1 Tax=Phytophthora citrophthora TaxID=4793 RepID=A0AAD9LCF3_9STRA|nr:2-methylene-furan-3-one reductase [Phytophthora citrophthora]